MVGLGFYRCITSKHECITLVHIQKIGHHQFLCTRSKWCTNAKLHVGSQLFTLIHVGHSLSFQWITSHPLLQHSPLLPTCNGGHPMMFTPNWCAQWRPLANVVWTQHGHHLDRWLGLSHLSIHIHVHCNLGGGTQQWISKSCIKKSQRFFWNHMSIGPPNVSMLVHVMSISPHSLWQSRPLLPTFNGGHPRMCTPNCSSSLRPLAHVVLGLWWPFQK